MRDMQIPKTWYNLDAKPEKPDADDEAAMAEFDVQGNSKDARAVRSAFQCDSGARISASRPRTSQDSDIDSFDSEEPEASSDVDQRSE